MNWCVVKIGPLGLPEIDTVGTQEAAEERAEDLRKVGRTVTYCGAADECDLPAN